MIYKNSGAKKGIGYIAGSMASVYLMRSNYEKEMKLYRLQQDIAEEFNG